MRQARFYSGSLFTLVVLLFLGIVDARAAFLPRSAPQGTPVYRFWSDVYKHQFLTLSAEEKNHTIAYDANWRYDGIAYYAFAEQIPNTVPLYRFWSDNFRGDHTHGVEQQDGTVLARHRNGGEIGIFDGKMVGNIAAAAIPEKTSNSHL